MVGIRRSRPNIGGINAVSTINSHFSKSSFYLRRIALKTLMIQGRDMYSGEKCLRLAYLNWRKANMWGEDFLAEKIVEDPMPLHIQKLIKLGIEHEINVIAKMRSRIVEVKLVNNDYETAVKETIKLMGSGKEYIYQGVLMKWEKVDGKWICYKGTPDFLHRIKGTSRFGNYCYEIVDIKSAKNVKDEHYSQLGFYNYLLEETQGILAEDSESENKACESFLARATKKRLPLVYILNINLEKIPLDKEKKQAKALYVLKNLQDIALQKLEPIPWKDGDVCKECIWKTACFAEMFETENVSLIQDIGQVKGKALYEVGIKTWSDVYRNNVEKIRVVIAAEKKAKKKAKKEKNPDVKKSGIGIGPVLMETLPLQARALKEQTWFWRRDYKGNPNPIELPEKIFEFVLDFEGGTAYRNNFIYLAGIHLNVNLELWLKKFYFDPLNSMEAKWKKVAFKIWHSFKFWELFLDYYFAPKIKDPDKRKQKRYLWWYTKINALRNWLRKRQGRPKVKVVRGRRVEIIQFLAEDARDERTLWEKLARLFSQYSEDLVVYHYGEYERTVLWKMQQNYKEVKLTGKEKTEYKRLQSWVWIKSLPSFMRRGFKEGKFRFISWLKNNRADFRAKVKEDTDVLFRIRHPFYQLNFWESFEPKMLDLNRTVETSLILPIISYSLKTVAHYLCDYRWRSEQVEMAQRAANMDAASSMFYFQEYKETGNPEYLRYCVVYNEDDIEATGLLPERLREMYKNAK